MLFQETLKISQTSQREKTFLSVFTREVPRRKTIFLFLAKLNPCSTRQQLAKHCWENMKGGKGTFFYYNQIYIFSKKNSTTFLLHDSVGIPRQTEKVSPWPSFSTLSTSHWISASNASKWGRKKNCYCSRMVFMASYTSDEREKQCACREIWTFFCLFWCIIFFFFSRRVSRLFVFCSFSFALLQTFRAQAKKNIK